MGGNTSGNDDDIIAAINVTPLVDVVLVLLIIFLITAPVLYQASMKIQLPKAKSAQPAQQSPYNFIITKDGELALDNKIIDWQSLPGMLSKDGDLSQKTAVISADTATPHGTVIHLLDLLRQGGLTHFALNVEATQTPQDN
jgi:biopolymer transport protein ExbD